MKLSAHLGYLFQDLALEDRFSSARAAGFEVVEHPSPYLLSAARFRELCLRNGLSVAQIGLPMGEAARGEKGLAALPGREDEFRDGLKGAIDYAAALDCPLIHPMAGVLPAGSDREGAWETYLSNLGLACAEARRAGLTVAIEPIGPGTVADYVLDHPDLALKAMAVVKADNLRLTLDTFHAANAGVDPAGFVRAHGQTIAHVQVADSPGRHEPGTGSLDFAAIFEALHSCGYQGVIGLEYHPRDGVLAGLAWASRFPGLIEPLRRRSEVADD